MRTASIGAWFDLPAYTFAQYKRDTGAVNADADARQRPTIDEVRAYLTAYVRVVQLTQYMHTGVRIVDLRVSAQCNMSVIMCTVRRYT
jgi:hypothetical protein